jgi:hypothetical protein
MKHCALLRLCETTIMFPRTPSHARRTDCEAAVFHFRLHQFSKDTMSHLSMFRQSRSAEPTFDIKIYQRSWYSIDAAWMRGLAFEQYKNKKNTISQETENVLLWMGRQANMRNRSRFHFQMKCHERRITGEKIRDSTIIARSIGHFRLLHASSDECTQIGVQRIEAIDDTFHSCTRSGGWLVKACLVGLVQKHRIYDKLSWSLVYFENHSETFGWSSRGDQPLHSQEPFEIIVMISDRRRDTDE